VAGNEFVRLLLEKTHKRILIIVKGFAKLREASQKKGALLKVGISGEMPFFA